MSVPDALQTLSAYSIGSAALGAVITVAETYYYFQRRRTVTLLENALRELKPETEKTFREYLSERGIYP